ncbi:RNA/RNP complex-1-interacting phosphatase [Phlebotomus argentipes]|uniref:RNA/RNP complex-1-interacting phosphatase n=1 Tax=Phlebotomus argentipes TaxID=94469 RepID=UPI002892A0E8|nr:RNA/RNP complex-1-interacting phosphatase [Phlebotomus argentipes]XP_059611009.1 RNA/RNP complex-1-interacting phosphatase [Phlebotomus argentipes]XP_059611010.1 RNA/RNP complex-1-interacting phosphatase [Phlebotomus argentipes]
MGKGSKIPDRWLDYSNVGRPIEGTQLIAFKTPLMQTYNAKLTESTIFTPDNLVELIPNLGLIIDLTASYRYYDPKKDLTADVEHVKLITQGHVVPEERNVSKFKKIISDFVADDKNASLLVGVHCTHGVNRTGYMICRYLMDCLNLQAEDAIKRVEEARGHSIERKNYTARLRSLNSQDAQEIDYARNSWRNRDSSLSTRYSDWRTPSSGAVSRSYREREYITRRDYDRISVIRSTSWNQPNMSWRNPNVYGFRDQSSRYSTERPSYSSSSRYNDYLLRNDHPDYSRNRR